MSVGCVAKSFQSQSDTEAHFINCPFDAEADGKRKTSSRDLSWNQNASFDSKQKRVLEKEEDILKRGAIYVQKCSGKGAGEHSEGPKISL